jgi:hypothetical protein
MIECYAGQMQIVCECGVSQRDTYAADEFDMMVSDARHDGWAIQNIAGIWEHACPDCAAKTPLQRPLL